MMNREQKWWMTVMVSNDLCARWLGFTAIDFNTAFTAMLNTEKYNMVLRPASQRFSFQSCVPAFMSYVY